MPVPISPARSLPIWPISRDLDETTLPAPASGAGRSSVGGRRLPLPKVPAEFRPRLVQGDSKPTLSIGTQCQLGAHLGVQPTPARSTDASARWRPKPRSKNCYRLTQSA